MIQPYLLKVLALFQLVLNFLSYIIIIVHRCYFIAQTYLAAIFNLVNSKN